jgi:adenosine kinase
MARHTAECREAGIPFAADPSQQVAWLSGDDIRNLIEGATYLFTNSYEASVVEQKTGWSQDEISDRVEVRVTTLGADGARVQRRGEAPISVPVAAVDKVLEPTGVGDAFRAGFFAGLTWKLGLERCAQLGSLLAAHVVETIGTQEYTFDRATFLKRFGAAYGADAAAEIEPHLPA